MSTFTSYPIQYQHGKTSTRSESHAIDIFGSYSAEYGIHDINALPAGEPSRLDGPALAALAALALIIAGLPVLTLALEKLA